ncbi:MAG: 7-carboxy-7-deazaguanine synthase [Saprospiraceae bacterium]|nr:7-carboxy-7-deazaguanine synthase [Bacteroidia bacterium]MBT8229562.1 7-carboxy-7-deazaguanine synthase [Bacteroidia bacterium]NNF21556.1 7-carboxy-7-deazaguanine synthase [Saprospiraceae bacterium]
MSVYAIKEIYYTLQGEASHAGRPAIFCRFSGCNLWSGREEDRHKAICQFCDTDFWGTDGENGGKYSAEALIEKLISLWPSDISPFVVFTGGEPALQLDESLIGILKAHHFEIAIETNGTLELPDGIDWICMSPKANTDIVINSGNEIKIIYPQKGIDPLDFKEYDFEFFYIQPMDNPDRDKNTKACIEFCKANPQWRLSLQTHKYLDIP